MWLSSGGMLFDPVVYHTVAYHIDWYNTDKNIIAKLLRNKLSNIYPTFYENIKYKNTKTRILVNNHG